MSKELNEIQKKLHESINSLCSYIASSSPKEIRYCYIPLINNLEEAYRELGKIDCEYNLKKLNEEESNDWRRPKKSLDGSNTELWLVERERQSGK